MKKMWLATPTEISWKSFIEHYHSVNSVKIPRWIRYCTAELHVFSDVSEREYHRVVYIRIETAAVMYTLTLKPLRCLVVSFAGQYSHPNY